MKKLLACLAFVFVGLVTANVFKSLDRTSANSPSFAWEGGSSVVPMPEEKDHPLVYMATQVAPIEQRGIEFKKWLAPSLKIAVQNASGSGTIVFYNPQDGYAYVQSCGHLWNGSMSAEQGKSKSLTCHVITWYHNDVKLPSPKKYLAEVLWYYNVRGTDSSLLRFKPDWVPDFFPIGSVDYKFNKGDHLHSVGCDGGREVAHYDIEVVGLEASRRNSSKDDLVTRQNSPRPGRSGGGLFTDDGHFVGICWGTSNPDGSGIGLFTPLQTIREMNESNGYGWLNNVGVSPAREIPILDRNNSQKRYPKNYIPLPGIKT
jgi:hypothetical protein